MYDYLIVGAGLYGSVFGRIMAENGFSVLIVDKRTDIGGNVFSEEKEKIQVHVYGPHIFHTNSDRVWEFLNKFTEFNNYRHAPKTISQGKVYSLPFNMNTFNQLWGVVTPEDAKQEIEKQKVKIDKPSNLEEFALSQVGRDIYDKLIYGYTKKQWQREPRNLPASIIRRLPIRFTYDDNYFNDKYQGIPINGYTAMVQNITDHTNIEFMLGTDFFEMECWKSIAKKLVYTGSLDEYFEYKFGVLEYRTLKFENHIVEGNFQGISQMNYADIDIPWTRIIEHKHFALQPHLPKSVITYEFPKEWEDGDERYYPINDDKNNDLYDYYLAEMKKEENILIGGRLSSYRYFDMDQTIAQALTHAYKETSFRVSSI